MKFASRRVCPVIKAWTKKKRIKRATLKRAERFRTDPIFAAQENARARNYYRENPKKYSEIRKVQRDKDRESYNEYHRKYYRANKSKLLGFIYRERKRENPIQGLHSAIRAFASGNGCIGEVYRRFDKADKDVNRIIGYTEESQEP